MLSTTALLLPAFIAGFITFLAPCTLPLVPAYLAFIGGVSFGDMADPLRAPFVRRRIFLNGLFYVIGFSTVFVLLGTLFGLGGGALVHYRIPLARLGGAMIVLFGLAIMGVFGGRIMLFERSWHPALPAWLHPGTPLSSFVFGATFAFGWTPCIGPILASILLLASNVGSLWEGGMLLAVFAAGLGVPFLLVALLFSSVTPWLRSISKFTAIASKIAGGFLVLLGFLILFNSFSEWTSFLFRIFGMFNYNQILRYL
ncbi:MAG: cytochrome c biogenesis protein CcdA [Patescibacteria group bacterium]